MRRFVPRRAENAVLPSMVHPHINVVGQGVLYVPDGMNVSFPFKLDFLCSNNEAKYEARFLGFISAFSKNKH